MKRLPLEAYEKAARALAEAKGMDPEELTFPGGAGQEKTQRWKVLAHELRAHHEREEALTEGGL